MTTIRSRATPGLSTFLDALETRMRSLGAEGTIAALLTHAQRLPSGARHEFLAIFPETGTPVQSSPDEMLLADIDTFVERARAGELDADDDHDDWYRDEDEEYAPWVTEADALFGAAAEEFIAGRLDLARQAYQRLFEAFRPYERGGSGLELWRLQATDVDEATARYLRCVYDTAPPGERARTIHRAYLDLSPAPGHRPPMLADIAGARRGDLPDLPAFLPGWIDALMAETPALSTRQRRYLLTEATLLHGGPDALAGLARRPGPHRPGTYLDWIDALTGAGRLEEAAVAAREALALTPPVPHHAARAADRLADLCAQLDDPTGAIEARRRAWRTDRTRDRLIDMATTAQAAGTAKKVLTAEARRCRTGADRLSCELFLLAGQIDAAATALANADPRGWSDPTHPGPVVLPYLLVAATATAPPDSTGTRLGHLFAGIDDLPQVPNYQRWTDLDHDELFYPDDEPANDPGNSLVALLTEQLSTAPTPATRRGRWQTTAATIIDGRVEAIVTNKNRRAYARAADLIVAYAEAQTITGTGNGHGYIDTTRQRYPRHSAFRAELDAAAQSSTLVRPAFRPRGRRSRW